MMTLLMCSLQICQTSSDQCYGVACVTMSCCCFALSTADVRCSTIPHVFANYCMVELVTVVLKFSSTVCLPSTVQTAAAQCVCVNCNEQVLFLLNSRNSSSILLCLLNCDVTKKCQFVNLLQYFSL